MDLQQSYLVTKTHHTSNVLLQNPVKYLAPFWLTAANCLLFSAPSSTWNHQQRSEELCTICITRMWANVQRDGCPAKYRWRPLFNVAKFGWRPLLECSAVTLPRRETGWNLQGCPKLANRSQPLVDWSSPYYEDMWRRYRCLTSFFSDCRYMPQLQRHSPTKLCDGVKMAIILRTVFSASRMQHISDMHSKFALRPYHVRKYGRHPISDRWD